MVLRKVREDKRQKLWKKGTEAEVLRTNPWTFCLLNLIQAVPRTGRALWLWWESRVVREYMKTPAKWPLHMYMSSIQCQRQGEYWHFFSDKSFYSEKSRLERAVQAEWEQLRRTKRERYQQPGKWVTREANRRGSAQVVKSSWPWWVSVSSGTIQDGYIPICVTSATINKSHQTAFGNIGLWRKSWLTCFWTGWERTALFKLPSRDTAAIACVCGSLSYWDLYKVLQMLILQNSQRYILKFPSHPEHFRWTGSWRQLQSADNL